MQNSLNEPGTGFRSELGTSTKNIWIASSGGHLTQALRIERLIGKNPESLWITNDTPDSRAKLNQHRSLFVPYVRPRDVAGALKTARLIQRAVHHERFDAAISTGAAIAGVALPLEALHTRRAYYIESVARHESPSLTGRLMRIVPWVSTRNQYSDSHWWGFRYIDSHLGTFSTTQLQRQDLTEDYPLNIFVTLGTIQPYRFDRLVDWVIQSTGQQDHVRWQLGSTIRSDLPGEAYKSLTPEEMNASVLAADVVITHAGVGSLVLCSESGKFPLIGVRMSRFNEHIDDHQASIAREYDERGIGRIIDLSRPDRATLVHAASKIVTESAAPIHK